MSFLRFQIRTIAALAAFALAPLAHAHVTLQVKEAPIDTNYKAIFGVSHGCEGSATTKIRVRIPEGVVGVKPQPKAGWSLSTVKGDYEKPHMQHGTKQVSGVKEVIWTGGPLLDEHFDEFVLKGYLSSDLAPNTTLYFPVVQECEKGVTRWIDVPSATDEKASHHHHAGSPAPGVKLLPKQ